MPLSEFEDNLQNISLFCVFSLPRSGSTVLTAQLDEIKGIVCVPENYFPCLISFLDNWESCSEEILAELFLAATDDKNILNYYEVLSCIQKDNLSKTFVGIGLLVASKAGRSVEDVKAVVWKTTRLVSGFSALKEAGFKFVLLQRNPLNVLGSQFRVGFGEKNRRPLRFVLFNYSYQSVFRDIAHGDTFLINYSDIKDRVSDLSRWMGVGAEKWNEGHSVVVASMASSAWHSGLSKQFNDKDAEKIESLSSELKFEYILFSALFYPLVYFLKPVRKYLDAITAQKLIKRIDGDS